MITCEIDMKLPSLNSYINVCRGNRYNAAKYKRNIEDDIAVFIARLPRFKKPIYINFTWVEDSHRRDPDNVCAGGRKFILDCMVKAGKITDDSRRYVAGFSDTFTYGKKAKVILEISEIG